MLSDRASGLRELLSSIVEHDIALAVWGVDTRSRKLYPREVELVARAVPSRVEEFAMGRSCARAALKQLGMPGAEILVGPHREPLWPDAVVGSITHASGLVAAVAGRASEYAGIGIDVEGVTLLDEEVTAAVLTPGEIGRGAADDAIRTFSAKEAVHKALFPLTGRWLDFLDVEVVFEEKSRFSVRAAEMVAGPPAELALVRGRARVTSEVVVTSATIPAHTSVR